MQVDQLLLRLASHQLETLEPNIVNATHESPDFILISSGDTMIDETSAPSKITIKRKHEIYTGINLVTPDAPLAYLCLAADHRRGRSGPAEGATSSPRQLILKERLENTFTLPFVSRIIDAYRLASCCCIFQVIKLDLLIGLSRDGTADRNGEPTSLCHTFIKPPSPCTQTCMQTCHWHTMAETFNSASSSLCEVCGKELRKDSVVKRHERYCRNRKKNPQPPRRKSCLPCIRAKTRCDSRKPACETCHQRRRQCLYTNERLATRERRHNLTRHPTDYSQHTSVISNMAALQNTPSCVSGHSSTSVEPPELCMPQLSSDFTLKGHIPMGTSPVNSHVATTKKLLEMPSPVPTNILRRKTPGRSVHSPLKNIVSQALCSFPERMMDKHTYPPFIHPSILTTSNITPCVGGDPITVCRDICHRFLTRQIANDMAFWDTVAQEQERIYDLRFSPSKWVHLASAQAITIYLLLLSSNRDHVLPHHPNLPITLLFTLRTNFEHLHQMLPGYTISTKQTECRPCWEDWIFAESKLRTATVYFILASCYDVNFGLPFDRDIDHEFGEIELPATKSLWEATDEVSWNKVLDLAISAQCRAHPAKSSETRLNYTNLIELNKLHSDPEGRATMDGDLSVESRVETWYKEMDELGMLVSLCSVIGD